jgi:hypothetical protein
MEENLKKTEEGRKDFTNLLWKKTIEENVHFQMDRLGVLSFDR